MLQRDTLRRLWPHCPPVLIEGIVAQAPSVFAKYGLDSVAVVAIFMAQISHECGGGTEIVENLNYSANRLTVVWPRHFPTIASAVPYQHNPKKLANFIYEPPIHKDLGNREGTDDGWNYRGRGPTNCTGADGYRKLGARMGLDLLSNPDLVNDPRYFLEAGVADFVLCGCLEPAKRGDFRMVTRRLNGGYIGLAQRQEWLKRWQAALAAEHGEDAVSVPLPRARPATPGVLVQGDKGPDVKLVQQQLSDKGYACGADDGEFHEATRDAVNSFKADNGLPTDGTADAATRQALATAPDRPIGEGRATSTADDLRDAGSRTVASADKIGALGKLKLGIGTVLAGGAGGQQLGLLNLDTIQSGVDKAHQAYGIIDSIKDLARPILTSPLALPLGVALAVLGVVVLWHSRAIILARLDDHRSGANMGR